jgi:hypothetical protein
MFPGSELYFIQPGQEVSVEVIMICFGALALLAIIGVTIEVVEHYKKKKDKK